MIRNEGNSPWRVETLHATTQKEWNPANNHWTDLEKDSPSVRPSDETTAPADILPEHCGRPCSRRILTGALRSTQKLWDSCCKLPSFRELCYKVIIDTEGSGTKNTKLAGRLQELKAGVMKKNESPICVLKLIVSIIHLFYLNNNLFTLNVFSDIPVSEAVCRAV